MITSSLGHDEVIPNYLVKTNRKDWDCFAPSHTPTRPLAMTKKDIRHYEERKLNCIACTDCSCDEVIPNCVVKTKRKVWGLPACSADRLRAITHPTLPLVMTFGILRCSLIFLLTFITSSLSAQSAIDILTIGGVVGIPSAYQNPLNGKATESNLLVNLKLPTKFNDKTIWYNDFTYSGFNVTNDIEVRPTEYLTAMRMHGIILQTGVVRKINDRNGFQLLAVPRYMSDFKGSDSKSWQLGAIALFEHRKHERLMTRYGFLYNQELFGPLLVPLIYLDWQINDKWSITGLMPINLKISYKVNEALTAGFSHFGFITTYRLGQEEFKTDYIERNSIDETLFARWNTHGNIFIEVRFGYSLSRVYEQYRADDKMDLRLSIVRFGDERTPANVNFDNGMIASVRLVYSLPLK
ncbi:MAG: hypothetical protein KF803_18940 [Cyclobacteriaceae bacterium]|nr:hypothetical protein [Cyclobacteriaceae bacterium]